MCKFTNCLLAIRLGFMIGWLAAQIVVVESSWAPGTEALCAAGIGPHAPYKLFTASLEPTRFEQTGRIGKAFVMKLFIAAAALIAVFIAQPAMAKTIDLDWNVGVGLNIDATVSLGDTVRWTWKDTALHNVTGAPGPPGFGSGNISGLGTTYSYTFVDLGDWDYVCTIHAGSMQGTISVVVPPVPALGAFGLTGLCAVLLGAGFAVSRMKRTRA